MLPPPGGPAVTGVVERRASNAVVQEIHLGTTSHVPGENILGVAYFGPVANAGTDNAAPADHRLSTSSIAAGLRSDFPGVAMQISPLYVQNAYGPFGYAIGRSGRDLCLYGWQRISAREDAPRLFAQRGTVQIRLRYCQTGASEADLLNVMYGYTLTGFFDSASWNPFEQAEGPNADIGRKGRPIYPQGGMGAQTVLPDASPIQPTPRPRRRTVAAKEIVTPRRLQSKAAPAATPAPRGPKVPLPAASAPATPAAGPVVPLPGPTDSSTPHTGP